ncbi:Phosphotransferase enzyme family protein [Tsuneonella dongtanensis]|uniref:Phosphotransferase enzyme family protein n=1 Tax=Tsuneonella dongtanensis TaxID=692370 RepID=A0A1B2AET6_9SPHN|nr:phosphotransferase [Tsuneonella dongtanensis]ANY20646.1 Phosphotransferase enzyme family protein [Tsuneonella dongtanensis]
MGDFPTTAAEVSAEWLTGRLRQAGALDHGRVTSIEWQPIGTGQVGDSARFALRYEGGEGPPTIAGKFPAADPTSRGTAAAFGLYVKEVGFYRELAPKLDVRVPRTYAAEVNDDGGEFVLLFEDLGPCRQGNQLDSCSLADARHAVRQAAAIHAPSWNDPTIVDLEWLSMKPEAVAQIMAMYPQAHAIFADRYADSLEPELMAVCHSLNEAREAWFGREQRDRCLIHGDFRLDNMLFDIRGGEEPIAVLDWQTVSTGSGLTDIGYFLGCGIGDALRREAEGELLDLYCAEMTARGVPLDHGAVWDHYRLGALHGISTAVFSSAFVERTERGDANFLSMARGACALALAHNSIGLLSGKG